MTIEKVFDKDTSLTEGIRTLFHEEGITIISVLKICKIFWFS